MEDIKKQRRNFISLSELGYDHLKFSFDSGGFAYIWRSEWVGIIAIKTERRQIPFLCDVLVALASLDLNGPINDTLGLLEHEEKTCLEGKIKWESKIFKIYAGGGGGGGGGGGETGLIWPKRACGRWVSLYKICAQLFLGRAWLQAKLYRLWFSASRVLNRVHNFTIKRLEQGLLFGPVPSNNVKVGEEPSRISVVPTILF